MTSHRVLVAVFTGGVTVAVIATVCSLGLQLTGAPMLAPLRRWRLLAGMVVLNAAAIPALAWGLSRAVPMEDAAAVGLALAATGAGSAAGLKVAQLSRRADLALALALAVVLQVANLVAVPLWSRVIAGAAVSRVSISRNLLILIVLPLVVGLVVRARRPAAAARLYGPVSGLATAALVVAIIAGIAGNASALSAAATSWVPAVAVVTIAVGLALGAALGGRSDATRATTSLMSGVRLTSLGLVLISTQLAGDAAYLGPAITFALLDLVLPLALALVLAGQPRRR